MIAVDASILVYAHRPDSPVHDVARQKLIGLAEGSHAWAIPWPCVHEFMGVVTRARLYNPPTPMVDVLGQVDAWLESPSLVLLSEATTHWFTLRGLLIGGRVLGAKVHDARIAAICLDHGVSELWTADRDFSRFPDLKVVNPLVGRS